MELCRRTKSIKYGLKWMDNLTLSLSLPIRKLWGKIKGGLSSKCADHGLWSVWNEMKRDVIGQFKIRQEVAAKFTISSLERHWRHELYESIAKLLRRASKWEVFAALRRWRLTSSVATKSNITWGVLVWRNYLRLLNRTRITCVVFPSNRPFIMSLKE